MFLSAQAWGSPLYCGSDTKGISRMQKALIVAVNICIMAAIMVFVVLYAGFESRDAFQRH